MKAAADEMWAPSCVGVLVDGEVGCRAEIVEQKKDLVLLDQTADLFDVFRWTVGVIEADKMILRPFTPPLS